MPPSKSKRMTERMRCRPLSWQDTRAFEEAVITPTLSIPCNLVKVDNGIDKGYLGCRQAEETVVMNGLLWY